MAAALCSGRALVRLMHGPGPSPSTTQKTNQKNLEGEGQRHWKSRGRDGPAAWQESHGRQVGEQAQGRAKNRLPPLSSDLHRHALPPPQYTRNK